MSSARRAAALGLLSLVACTRPPEPTCVGVTVDPTPSRRAPSAWTGCGEGCRVLALGSGESIFGAVASARAGRRTLGYTRQNGIHRELRVESLDASEVLLAVSLDERATRCAFELRAVESTRVLLDTNAFGDGWSSVVVEDRAWRIAPRVDARALEVVASDALIARTTRRNRVSVDGVIEPVWTSTGGLLAGNLATHRRALFFDVAPPGAQGTIQVWTDDGRGARPLAPGCCLRTDGVEMTWLEAGGEGVWRKAAPYTAEAGTLVARTLRRARLDVATEDDAVIGGGFVLQLERRRGDPWSALTLTRLQDGASWELAPRGAARWGRPLYVDGAELAVVEHPARAQDASTPTIVRYDVAALIARAPIVARP